MKTDQQRIDSFHNSKQLYHLSMFLDTGWRFLISNHVYELMVKAGEKRSHEEVEHILNSEDMTLFNSVDDLIQKVSSQEV